MQDSPPIGSLTFNIFYNIHKKPHSILIALSLPPKYAIPKTYSSHELTYPSMDGSLILSIH